MNREELIEKYSEPIKVLNHGWVRVVDCMGGDEAVEQAARLSYQKGTRKSSDTRGLLRYLLRKHHTTPFECCSLKIGVKLPIFVERQWARHRTAKWNELSGRYSELPEEFYTPEISQVCYQATDNKQGRSGPFPAVEAEQLQNQMAHEAEDAFATYRQFLEAGMSRETARIGLPLSTYTEKIWTQDLHNLLHFLGLRMAKDAQYEIRVYADVIGKILQDWAPITYEAFVDYKLEAATLSRMELAFVRNLVEEWKEDMGALAESENSPSEQFVQERIENLLTLAGVETKRERVELLEKLGLA
jgi:thymidylate synthase (FAD)